jgi:hypothetical protein
MYMGCTLGHNIKNYINFTVIPYGTGRFINQAPELNNPEQNLGIDTYKTGD